MGTLMKASLLALAALAAASSHAAEPTGEMMAATCAGCHGTHGKLGTVEFVPLAGLSEQEFVRAMRDFKSGKRPATLMGVVANGFSDNEIKSMAHYFAGIKLNSAK
jgi:sulfide dehydrogenase cytochrome subunit